MPLTVSVTNPEPGAIPEEVDVYISFSGSIWPTLIRSSNLVQLGATVMDFPADYEDLTELLLEGSHETADELGRGSFGRVLRAIREDDLVPATLGKNVLAYRLQAFVLGSAAMALAGLGSAERKNLAHNAAAMPLVWSP